MKTLKVCMKCQIEEKEQIEHWIKNGVFTFVDNCLKEDCKICRGGENEEEIKVKESLGFKDSWVLWYKIEGMNESVQQFHLTKEECEIIYGNLTNLTYWHMEVMK